MKKSILIFIISFVTVLLSQDIGVFWDNVLFVSKMGGYIYENNLSSWYIPAEFDPGHPPLIGFYLALGWTLFGKTLVVSHWLMFPLIFGVLWQIYSFVANFIKDLHLQLAAFFLVAIDPTLLSQFVLVNPEIIQTFFFLLTLNAILRNRFYWKVIGLMFLGIVSYRGMMLCFGLFLVDLLIHLFVKKGTLRSFLSKETIVAYAFGATPAVIFVLWKYLSAGYIIRTGSDSPWAGLSHFVSFKEFWFNVAVLIQRFIDFGRVSILLVISIALFVKRKSINKDIVTLLIISIFSTIAIIVVSLVMTNTMGHRYYIVSYVALALLAFILLREFKFKKILYIGLMSSLLLGNLIVYPDDFAQGWDASLAHLPYWGLRRDAISFMDNENIPVAETATFFPNITTIDNVDFNGDKRSFQHFTGQEEYVFYSNVYNLTDEEFDLLDQYYETFQTFNKNGVRVELKKRITISQYNPKKIKN